MGIALKSFRDTLANFAATLLIETDSEKLSMMSERQLKRLIIENKGRFSVNEYYMKAGIAGGITISNAVELKNEHMSDVYDGIGKFYEFLKVNDIKDLD